MPETHEEIEELLLKINQDLGALKSQIDADTKVNGKLLQQLALLAQIVGALNAKLNSE